MRGQFELINVAAISRDHSNQHCIAILASLTISPNLDDSLDPTSTKKFQAIDQLVIPTDPLIF